MTQYDFGSIIGSDSGMMLAADLNSWRDALNTTHQGSAQPVYRQAGMIWIDDSGAGGIWTVKMYDGVTWIPMYQLDTVNHLVRLGGGLRLRLSASASPNPTVAGDARFDTDKQRIQIGYAGTSTRNLSLSNLETIEYGALPAGVSFIDFVDLAPFRMLKFSYRATVSAVSSLYIRISTDNGASFYGSTASDYTYTYFANSVGPSVSANNGATSYFPMTLGASINPTTTQGEFGVVTFYEFNQAIPFMGEFQGGHVGNAPAYWMQDLICHTYYVTQARNAFRFAATSGATFTGGHYLLEGVR
jgi:hypothetical protein